LFFSSDFSDFKKGAFKFLCKSICDLIGAFRCYGAQQIVILAAGERIIDRVKIKAGAKISQLLRNRDFIGKQAGTHPAFLNDMPQIGAQPVAGVDGGMNAWLPGEKSPFA
jgi:hypothetical protein